MNSEEFNVKSKGSCGVLSTKKERLLKWEAALKQRYTQLESEHKSLIRIELTSDNEKELKFKVSFVNNKSKNKQLYTFTIYRGESAKTMTIQGIDVNEWKAAEYSQLKELVDGKQYEDIKWSQDLLKEKEIDVNKLNSTNVTVVTNENLNTPKKISQYKK